MTPEIRFIPDDSFDRSQRVCAVTPGLVGCISRQNAPCSVTPPRAICIQCSQVLSLLKKIDDGSAEAPPIAVPGDPGSDYEDMDADWEESEEDYLDLLAGEDGDEELVTKGMSDAQRQAVSNAAMRDFLGGGSSGRGDGSDMLRGNNSPRGRGGKGNNRKRK